ncbi:Rho GTPase-activating protein 17 [Balamuthia mandrillaris]
MSSTEPAARPLSLRVSGSLTLAQQQKSTATTTVNAPPASPPRSPTSTSPSFSPPTSPGSSTSLKVKVLADYEAQDKNEMSLKKGETLSVWEIDSEKGRGLGRSKDGQRSGWFPMEMVQEKKKGGVASRSRQDKVTKLNTKSRLTSFLRVRPTKEDLERTNILHEDDSKKHSEMRNAAAELLEKSLANRQAVVDDISHNLENRSVSPRSRAHSAEEPTTTSSTAATLQQDAEEKRETTTTTPTSAQTAASTTSYNAALSNSGGSIDLRESRDKIKSQKQEDLSLLMRSRSTTQKKLAKGQHLPEFGVPLEELCKRYSAVRGLPFVVFLCVNRLIDTALDVEGIFRISVKFSEVTMLKVSLEQGFSRLLLVLHLLLPFLLRLVLLLLPPLLLLLFVNSYLPLPGMTSLDSVTNPHAVAAVMKQFFRELPEPLLTFDLFNEWMAAGDEQDSEKRMTLLRDLTKRLPTPNYETLFYLVTFLKLVAAHEDKNMMSELNLSVIFAPTLIRRKVETTDDFMKYATQQSIVQTLLEEYDFIFESKLEELKNNTYSYAETSSLTESGEFSLTESTESLPSVILKKEEVPVSGTAIAVGGKESGEAKSNGEAEEETDPAKRYMKVLLPTPEDKAHLAMLAISKNDPLDYGPEGALSRKQAKKFARTQKKAEKAKKKQEKAQEKEKEKKEKEKEKENEKQEREKEREREKDKEREKEKEGRVTGRRKPRMKSATLRFSRFISGDDSHSPKEVTPFEAEDLDQQKRVRVAFPTANDSNSPSSSLIATSDAPASSLSKNQEERRLRWGTSSDIHAFPRRPSAGDSETSNSSSVTQARRDMMDSRKVAARLNELQAEVEKLKEARKTDQQIIKNLRTQNKLLLDENIALVAKLSALGEESAYSGIISASSASSSPIKQPIAEGQTRRNSSGQDQPVSTTPTTENSNTPSGSPSRAKKKKTMTAREASQKELEWLENAANNEDLAMKKKKYKTSMKEKQRLSVDVALLARVMEEQQQQLLREEAQARDVGKEVSADIAYIRPLNSSRTSAEDEHERKMQEIRGGSMAIGSPNSAAYRAHAIIGDSQHALSVKRLTQTSNDRILKKKAAKAIERRKSRDESMNKKEEIKDSNVVAANADATPVNNSNKEATDKKQPQQLQKKATASSLAKEKEEKAESASTIIAPTASSAVKGSIISSSPSKIKKKKKKKKKKTTQT